MTNGWEAMGSHGKGGIEGRGTDHVEYDEEEVKARQERVLQANILHRRLVLVVLHAGHSTQTVVI
jgi:hypothetical protein